MPVLAYAFVIALLTLTSHPGKTYVPDTNWVPFASISDLWSGAKHPALVLNNVLGNLLLFAPLALLLRLLLIRSGTRVLAVVLMSSCLIELMQGLGLPDHRQADVDDVLLNVLGAALALMLVPRRSHPGGWDEADRAGQQ